MPIEEKNETDLLDLVPARMLNEFAYCPRLAYLEWVQGEFRESADTLEGSAKHRRVDAEKGKMPEPGGGEEKVEFHAQSVMLSGEKLGAIARIDLVKGTGKKATPVDYKKGKAPDIPEGAWEPERVQICIQGLILRENGYECDEGIIYYIGSKKKVAVQLDDSLVERTASLLRELKETALSGRIPPPLEDSPKCPRCSLVGICLPDEVNLLRKEKGSKDDVRRLVPARDDALPVYVMEQGATISKSGEVLAVKKGRETLADIRLMEVSQVSLFGQAQLTAPAMRELLSRSVPICHFSYGGWFYGMTHGMYHKNVELRKLQYGIESDPSRSLGYARAFVAGKIKNQRTMLRRNCSDLKGSALDEMNKWRGMAARAGNAEGLLGIEGSAARTYFANFPGMLKPPKHDGELTFDFNERNRRPPKDPVNALLSYVYGILVKDLTVTLMAVGFDPFLGLYHRPRYGRPSLALDLMEEFRPLVGDSVVIGLINNGEMAEDNFVRRGQAVSLASNSKKKVVAAYERRVDTLVTHPVFGYKISYRRVFEVQARMLARAMSGEIKGYVPMTTR